jgi:hypothetical protein
VRTTEVSSFLDGWWEASRVGVGEQVVAGRRKRRVLARVRRAAWRLEEAERERAWAVVTAHAEGASIREVPAAAGLPPSRVHQLVTGAGLDVLDAAGAVAGCGLARAGRSGRRRRRRVVRPRLDRGPACR